MKNGFEEFNILCRDSAFPAIGQDKTNRKGSIGTLGEKTLHALLKQYYEPDESKQEIKVGRFVADIKNDSGIIEVQTRNFNVLRRKLEAFLPEHEVTVVYPVAQTKWLLWINETTGEITKNAAHPKPAHRVPFARNFIK